ncbi:MAG: PHP domain-containing protein [Candidatus Acidiferrum sp.]
MEALAACHVHSKWSYDGSWSLEDLSARFAARGYRILMMTEHDRGFTVDRLAQYRQACAKASSDAIFVLPGIEYSDAANRVHVLVWGPVPFLGENLPTLEMLQAVKAANGFAVLAHPSRKDAWKSFEPSWTDKLLGVEVWNRKYDGWAPSKTAPDLVQTTGAVPFVGLDFHTHRQSFPLAMALDLQGASVSEASILDALSLRRCSARAFKLSLNQNMVRNALPVLNVVERSRKSAASIVKSAKRKRAK